MHWTIVCQQVPYPATHGGAVDMWRRLVALHELGVRVHLVCWANVAPSARDRAMLESVCDRLRLLHYRTAWWDRIRQLPMILRLPAPISTRRVDNTEFHAIVREAGEFGSQLVFSDGLMGGKFSHELATALRLPRFVRSHNIEHLYRRRLLEAANGTNRLKLALRLRNLEWFELEQLRTARQFFDISADDLAYWQSRGLENGVWLPPLATDEQLAIKCESETVFDIAFVGNLRMPNNVNGVRWLIQKVLPIVTRQLERVPRVLIAGSQPTLEIARVCGAVANLELRPNFSDLAKVLSAAKVLVNPMLTGSGVAMKTIDMLLSGRPVISTSCGVNGFFPEVKRLVRIADTPEAFASGICGAVTQGYRQDQVDVVRALFGRSVIVRLIDSVRAAI